MSICFLSHSLVRLDWLLLLDEWLGPGPVVQWLPESGVVGGERRKAQKPMGTGQSPDADTSLVVARALLLVTTSIVRCSLSRHPPYGLSVVTRIHRSECNGHTLLAKQRGTLTLPCSLALPFWVIPCYCWATTHNNVDPITTMGLARA
jgi:hypothetical protein